MNRVKVIGPRDPRDSRAINTTSRCKGLGRNFSPFLLGPVKLYKGAPCLYAENVENAWQYSKVYSKFLDEGGNITNEYFNWAKRGWKKRSAVRYPMGKGAAPEFSFWGGEKLGYIEARKRIYFPIYAKAVKKTEAFKKLKAQYDSGINITLWDFDGYNHLEMGMTLKDVLENTRRPMGHAFVIAALLEETFDK